MKAQILEAIQAIEKDSRPLRMEDWRDIREFLDLASEASLRPEVRLFPLADANAALVELKTQSVVGAKVLISPS